MSNLKNKTADIEGAWLHQLLYVFGFGSYFRGEPARDIDLLFVVIDDIEDCVELHNSIWGFAEESGLNLDITILSDSEFMCSNIRRDVELINLFTSS